MDGIAEDERGLYIMILGIMEKSEWAEGQWERVTLGRGTGK